MEVYRQFGGGYPYLGSPQSYHGVGSTPWHTGSQWGYGGYPMFPGYGWQHGHHHGYPHHGPHHHGHHHHGHPHSQYHGYSGQYRPEEYPEYSEGYPWYDVEPYDYEY